MVTYCTFDITGKIYHELEANKLFQEVSKTIFRIRQVLSGFFIWSSQLRYKFHPPILVEATCCVEFVSSHIWGFSKVFLVQQVGGSGGILDIDSKQRDYKDRFVICLYNTLYFICHLSRRVTWQMSRFTLQIEDCIGPNSAKAFFL